MYKAILAADLHIKDDSPDDLAYGIQMINDCGHIAQKEGCTDVVVAGDILHAKFRYSHELMLSVYNCLSMWHSSNVNFILLRGNHDTIDNGKPERSVLHIFNRVATVLCKAQLVEEEDCIILYLPWYPAELYRRLVKHYASYALGYNKPRILVSHISLQEGFVSASNTKINTPIRVADLLPEVWTGGVYLGDYHRADRVGKHEVYYLGSPRPYTHGDSGNIGVWKLSVGATKTKLDPIPLLSRYPEFKSYRVDSMEDLPLCDYDKRNKNRVFVNLDMRNHVANLYQDAKILPIETAPVSGGGRLLEKAETQTAMEIAMRWARMKGLGPEYKPVIKEYLQ